MRGVSRQTKGSTVKSQKKTEEKSSAKEYLSLGKTKSLRLLAQGLSSTPTAKQYRSHKKTLADEKKQPK